MNIDWDIPIDVLIRYHREDLRQIANIIDKAGGQVCDVRQILIDLTKANFIIQKWVETKVMNDKPVQLVTTPSDKERADEIRNLIVETAGPLMELLTKANEEGLTVQVSFGLNAFHKVVVQQIAISRQL